MKGECIEVVQYLRQCMDMIHVTQVAVSFRCMLIVCQGETHRTPLQPVLRLEVDRCIVAGRCEGGRRRRASFPCHCRRRRINLALQSRMPAVLDGIVGPARACEIASACYSRRQRRPRRRSQHLAVIRTAESRHTCRAIASRCVTICCRTERCACDGAGNVSTSSCSQAAACGERRETTMQHHRTSARMRSSSGSKGPLLSSGHS